MRDLNASDHRLIAELRRNGRASISELAAVLGLSRATVKARLDRLIADGVIERFTVDLSAGHEDEMLRAVMMIELAGGYSRAVIKAILGLPQVVRLHSTNGAWDLVAELECASLRDFDQALREIRVVQGVTNSQSCLLLDTLTS